MRIPPEILKSVLFLGHPHDKEGTDKFKAIATAFVVSVPHGNSQHEYLVTTKHATNTLGPGEQQIRVNQVGGDGSAKVITIDGNWWFHPNENDSMHDDDPVDIAVRPFHVSDSDIVPIPASMFLTDEAISEFYVGPGDEVSITGLFTRLMGKVRNVPIVRRGSVAMLPDDMIPSVNLGNRVRDMEGYLIEVRSAGGLSGSPAFVRAPVGVDYNVHTRSGVRRTARVHFQGDYFFLGLCQGHWEIHPDAINEIDFATGRVYEPEVTLASESDDDRATKKKESINLGIAIVVPAKRILEVLYQPDLMEKRTEEQRERRP